MLHRLLLLLTVLCAGLPAHAALVNRVAPFQGPLSESFESVEGATQLDRVLGGAAKVAAGSNTVVTVQDGTYYNLWNQTAFDGTFFLGGASGYNSPATVVIAFEFPVNAFGGQFGHRVRPGFDTSGETEFVFYDSRNRVIGRDLVFIGADPGSVGAYWKFGRDVKRITFTTVHPMADALTATMSPVQAKRFNRSRSKLK